MFNYKNWPQTLLINIQSQISIDNVINQYFKDLLSFKKIIDFNLEQKFKQRHFHDLILLNLTQKKITSIEMDTFCQQVIIAPIEELKTKIVVIIGIEKIDINSSQQLLKLIENKQENILFVFITFNYYNILPSIISRTLMFSWPIETTKTSNDKFDQFLNFQKFSQEEIKDSKNLDSIKQQFNLADEMNNFMINKKPIPHSLITQFVTLNYEQIFLILNAFLFFHQKDQITKELLFLQKSIKIHLNKKLIYMYLNTIVSKDEKK